MKRHLRTVPGRPPRRRIVLELDAADAAELDAAIEAQPVTVTRSAVVRAALRRGLAALHGGGGNTIAARCD